MTLPKLHSKEDANQKQALDEMTLWWMAEQCYIYILMASLRRIVGGCVIMKIKRDFKDHIFKWQISFILLFSHDFQHFFKFDEERRFIWFYIKIPFNKLPASP